jgi:ArsR family transcriptional regulator
MQLSNDFYELHANLCSIFSSPRRLEIIDVLTDKELTVSEILGSMSISKTNLSQHLTLMKDRGIVQTRREGQHIYYSITNNKIIRAYELMGEVLRELMDKKISDLNHKR